MGKSTFDDRTIVDMSMSEIVKIAQDACKSLHRNADPDKALIVEVTRLETLKSTLRHLEIEEQEEYDRHAKAMSAFKDKLNEAHKKYCKTNVDRGDRCKLCGVEIPDVRDR